MSQTAVTQPKQVSTVRKVLAIFLDLIFLFGIVGYAIAYATGDVTSEGFSLNGAPAMLLFAIVILYFIVFIRFLGGTIFQRLLGVR